MSVLLHIRPSELVEYEGTSIEKLMFDAMVLSKADVTEPTSTRELIRRSRARMGIYV